MSQEASSPETTPARLRELFEGSSIEIKRLLAKNPNTPKDILLKLCEFAPNEFIENPALPLLLLEEPNLLSSLDEKACAALILDTSKPTWPPVSRPDWVWEALALHPKGDVRARVAINPCASPAVLAYLVNDWASKKALSLNINAPRHVLEKLAVDPNHSLRYNVSSSYTAHTHKPLELIALLRRVGCTESLITKQAPDLTMTAEELVDVAARGYFAWELVAAHPNAPLSLLEKLSDKVERGIFSGPKQDDWEELKWIGQVGWDFFASLAQNPNATAALLVNAARVCRRHSHPSIRDVRTNLAKNPNTPEALLRELAAYPDIPGEPAIPIKEGVASNPNAPGDLLEQLSNTPVTSIKLALSKNPNTPIEVKKKLQKR